MRRVVILALAAAALGGCASKPYLHVDRAWVRLAAVPGAPAAAYFTVHGGERDAALASVTSDVALKAEMHETMTVSAGTMGTMGAGTMGAGAMSEMRPLARVPVPARATVAFAPGGRHVMLFDVNRGIKPGDTLTLTFRFADGTPALADAKVVAAGDPAPQ